MSWMKLSSVLDEMVFGRKCFWMSFFFCHLDESVPNRFVCKDGQSQGSGVAQRQKSPTRAL